MSSIVCVSPQRQPVWCFRQTVHTSASLRVGVCVACVKTDGLAMGVLDEVVGVELPLAGGTLATGNAWMHAQ